MVNLLLCAVCLTTAAPAGPGAVQPVVRVIRIDVPSHDAVYPLVRELHLDVIDAQPTFIKACADDATIARVRGLGYPVTVLFDDLRSPGAGVFAPHDSFPAVCRILDSVAGAHPAVARMETLGTSYSGHPIPMIEVTSNAGTPADKPVVRLIGVHHGNETQGAEICLYLLRYLTANYGSDPEVTSLVDTRDIWIIPVFNPDGYIAGTRENGAGVDLNRDYGYEWDDYTGTHVPFSQPETRALNALSERHVPTLEYAYHTDASYVNYLWDNTPVDPPDSGYIIAVSQEYADSTGSAPLTRLTKINGYDWYEVHGSCQDNTFGAFGGLATTVETKLPSTWARIDSVCEANRRALMAMMTRAGWGIAGLAYDSLSGAPLFARVTFSSPVRWNTYTNLPVGDFHKMLAPGTYDVTVSANGYTPRSFTGVVVPDTGAVRLNAALLRPDSEPLNYAQRIVVNRRIDPSHTNQVGVGPDALGAPDGRYYLLGPSSSFIILDLDPNLPCRNRPGADITVYATGSYTVQGSNNWQGPWTDLGSGTGTQGFDLGTAGMDSCRYLDITNTSSCQLDGVAYVGLPGAGVSADRPSPLGPAVSVRPNPARARAGVAVTLSGSAPARVRLVDVAGRVVRAFDTHTSSFVVSGLNPGVYYCRVEQDGRSATAKVTVR